VFETTAVISRKQPRRYTFLQAFPVTVLVHALAAGAVILGGIWEIEFPRQSPAQLVAFVMVVPTAPPPPPPPPPPSSTPVVTEKVEEIPVELLELAPTMIPDLIPDLPPPVPRQAEDEGVQGGVEGGVPGGTLGGVVGGVIGGVADALNSGERFVNQQLIIPLDKRLPLHPVSQVFPEFPEVARLAGLEGTVVVRYTIDKRGRVREVEVLRHSRSPLFDESAVYAIRNWRFKPLKRGDEFVEVVHDLTICFVLEEES
jgi:protein TonB